MRVILVRHGKTGLGAARRFQSANTPLSEEGLMRVEACATELAHEPVTKVYTSTYERAVETAQRIARKHQCVPEEHALFTEKYNGTKVIGRSYFSLPFLALAGATIGHLFVRRVRYGDEETLDELWHRVHEAKLFLETQAGKEEGIVVVSHAMWIAAFLAQIGTPSRSRIWRYVTVVLCGLFMRNTQRYTFEYDTVRKVWNRVISCNAKE